MSQIKVGFARLEISVPNGTFVAGYYDPRYSEGVIDPLYATALAVSDGEKTAVIMSLDLLGLSQVTGKTCAEVVAERNRLPLEAVYLTCTHTHTGPGASESFYKNGMNESVLFRRIADTAKAAIADLVPAEFSYALGEAKGVSFVRRYRMRDGSVQTNPGIGDPDIVAPMSQSDDSVGLVKIIREGKNDIAFVNFQTHPDTIGGNLLSADWPGFVRRTVESAIDGVNCIFVNGAEGDTNHINVFLPKGTPRRGYNTITKRIGHIIAGEVLKLYPNTVPFEADSVSFMQKDIDVETNKGTPEELERSKHIVACHEAGDKSIFAGVSHMEPVIMVAEAKRIIRAEELPETQQIPIAAVRIGEFVICGAAGEPFTDIGVNVKAQSPFTHTFYTCCTNKYRGYFSTAEAYSVNGYESRSSQFKCGIAEKITAETVELLKDLKESK